MLVIVLFVFVGINDGGGEALWQLLMLLCTARVICVAGGVSGGGGVAEKSLYGSVGAQNAPLLPNGIIRNGNGVPAARTSEELKPKDTILRV